MSRPVLSILVFLLLLIVLYVLHFFAEPVRRGFFCDDVSLRRPYHPQESFNSFTVRVICITLAIAIFTTANVLSTSKKTLKRLATDCVPYTFGFLISEIISIFVQTITGRLRPSFIEYCQPDVLSSSCIASNSSSGHHLLSGIFMDSFTCTTNQLATDYVRKSFYSARSSAIAYTSTYLICYLQNHLPMLPASLRALAQLLLTILAAVIGFSTLLDNHHFWDDVLAGLLAGSAIALYTYGLVKPHYDYDDLQSAAPVFAFEWAHHHQSPLPSGSIDPCTIQRLPPLSSRRLRQLFRSKSNLISVQELAPLTECDWQTFYQTL